MRIERRHVVMRLRRDLVEQLDKYVDSLRVHDDRVNRTETVENAIKLLLSERARVGSR